MSFPNNNPRRWLEELRCLKDDSSFGQFRFVVNLPPTIEGSFTANNQKYYFRLMWPPDYPYRPPTIWQLAEDGSIIAHHATGHAFVDQSICLYGHRPEDGWQPHFKVTHALERLRLFLISSDNFARIEKHPLKSSCVRVSIHPNVMNALRANAGWGLCSGFLRNDKRLIVITNTESTLPSGLIRSEISEAPSSSWHNALGLKEPWQGLWCRLDAGINEIPSTRTELIQRLHEKLKNEQAQKLFSEQSSILLIGDQVSWFIWLRLNPILGAMLASYGTDIVYTIPVEEDIRAKLFTRIDSRLKNADSLRAANVAMVGVGSLGSAIAVALAKAGITRFSLFDPDLFEPENVVRHVGCVSDIGLPKVQVVEQAIKKINPDAEVTCIQSAFSLDPVGWGIDSVQTLRDAISASCSIVVCATAISDSERSINALCVGEGKPVIFSSVLGNAEHGRIFRVIPQKTSCYQCVLIAQAADPGRYPRFETKDLGAPAYPQPGIPGLGLDIDEIAILTARLAIQTIAMQIPDGIGYPAAHADHIIWSARGDWAVDGPLQTRFERIPRQDNCPICGTGVGTPLNTDEKGELTRLIKENLR
jgi:molybdopterin/thiamine biosynthesis adenylyltransferase